MMPSSKIPIALVEDDAPYRGYVAALLESTGDRQVVFAVDSAEEGLRRMATTPVRVLLLDVGLPGISGAAAVRKFVAARPDLLVIMLTALDAEDLVLESLRAGACGYLLKGSSSEAVRGAVDDALAGGAPMSPTIAQRVLALLRAVPASVAPAAAGERLAKLTNREEEILARVAAGRSDKEIASELGTALSTVKNHLASVYGKWRVRSRTEAAVKFLGR